LSFSGFLLCPKPENQNQSNAEQQKTYYEKCPAFSARWSYESQSRILFWNIELMKQYALLVTFQLSKNDYREMVNASFRGGLTGKAKTIALGIKAMKNKSKKKQFW
jgi:hypothetical protein